MDETNKTEESFNLSKKYTKSEAGLSTIKSSSK